MSGQVAIEWSLCQDFVFLEYIAGHSTVSISKREAARVNSFNHVYEAAIIASPKMFPKMDLVVIYSQRMIYKSDIPKLASPVRSVGHKRAGGNRRTPD